VKNSLILIVLVITQVLGDIWLSQAMKIYGEITSYSPQAIFHLLQYLFTSIWIYLGVGTLAFSWLLYLISVSRLDLSYILAIHASSYILNGFMAWLILHEDVTSLRWLATLIIALGVFIVGWSEYLAHKVAKKRVQSKLERIQVYPEKMQKFIFALPVSFYLPKLWLGVLVLVFTDSAGDLLTAKGMKEVGSIAVLSLRGVVQWIGKMIRNSSLLLGILSQALSLLMFISLLSWDDISMVRPATALGYIVSLLGAKYVLHEKISKGRLMGITFIACGVMLISFS
jgi:drug/metabolite transporter (DMT)-like permease